MVRLGARKCGRPPMVEYDPRRVADYYGLPERSEVEAVLRSVVKNDKTILDLLMAALDYVYSVPPDRGFNRILYRDAARYRIPRECWSRALAGALVGLIQYCVDNPDDEDCKRTVTGHILQLLEEANASKIRALKASRRIGKVFDLFLKCARDWCKREEVVK